MHNSAIDRNMKKIISLILCLATVFGMMPAVLAAPVLDAVESAESYAPDTAAEAETETEAVTATLAAAGQTVPDSVPVYDSSLGELIYFENFEDGTWGNGYTIGKNAFCYNINDGDIKSDENGKYGLGARTTALQIENIGISSATSFTLKVDVMKVAADSALDGMNIWGSGLAEYPALTLGDNVTESAWTPITKTLNKSMTFNASGASEIYFRWTNLYVDNIAVYVKYDIGEKVRLNEGNTTRLVDAASALPAPAGTYNAWVDASGKVYAVGATAAAGAVLTAATVNYDEKPEALTDAGMLVFFDNFSGNTGFTNLGDFKVLGLGKTQKIIGGRMATVGSADDLFNAALGGIAVSAADDTSFKYVTGETMNGTLTLYYDIYDTSGKHTMWDVSDATGDSWSGWKTKWEKQYSAKEAWTTISLSRETTNSRFGRLNSESVSAGMYFSSVSVYYMPTNYVKLVEGDSTKLVDLGTATTYTVTAPANTANNVWVDASGKVYAVGATAAAGTVLTAATVNYAEKPVEYDATYGNLIYFDNFSGEDFENAVNLIVGGKGNGTIAGGYYGVTLTNEGNQPDRGLYITPATGTWAENGLNGKLTITMDVYAPESFRYWPVSDTKYSSNYAAWNDYWYTNYASRNTTANAYATISVSGLDLSRGFNKFGFSSPDPSKSSSGVVRSVAVYYMPTNYVKLVEGASTKLVDLGTATTYTVTAPANTANNVWRDTNGKIYFAGDTAAAGTTLTASYFDTSVLSHETKGKAIWYNDFSYSMTKPAYEDERWSVTTEYGKYNGNVYTNELTTYDNKQVLHLRAGEHDGISFTFDKGNDIAGSYMVTINYYAERPDGSTSKDSVWISFNGTAGEGWETGDANSWKEFSHRGIFGEGSVISDAWFRINRSWSYYIDSIAIYYLDYNPATVQAASIKTSTDMSGIRVAGFASNTVRNMAAEYGFVVGLETVYGENPKDIKVGAEDTAYVAAYIKDTETDYVYVNASESTDQAKAKFGSKAFDDKGYYFTAVYTGVPMNATALTTKIIGRTYVKIGSNYFYGEPISRSVYDVAKALYDTYDDKTLVPEYVKTVYDIVNQTADQAE